MIRAAAASAALLLAAPAAAQEGAMWVDQHGRMMELQFGGGNGLPPAPVDRPAEEMARLFKSLCLDAGGSAAQPGAAAGQAGLTSSPVNVPAGKAGPVILNIWRGNGIVLAQTGGFFAAPVAQCNATFYVSTLPERASVADALSAAIGSGPTNTADATDKKGKPKKYYSPEWRIAGASGEQIVSAHVGKGSPYSPGSRVQVSVRASKKAGK